jgi:hypothetical protein
MEDNEDRLTRALIAAAKAILAELEPSPSRKDPGEAHAKAGSPEDPIVEWDPLYGAPPFTANPNSASFEARDEKDMAVIAYLGGIARVNAEFERGARSDEISAFAVAAGYSGGNAVNGWNSNDRAQGAVEVRAGKERFLNRAGHESHLKPAIERQSRRLRVTGNMTPIDIPDQ